MAFCLVSACQCVRMFCACDIIHKVINIKLFVISFFSQIGNVSTSLIEKIKINQGVKMGFDAAENVFIIKLIGRLCARCSFAADTY